MTRFRINSIFQMRLLPTDPRKWIEDNDLIFFICALLDQLNLESFYSAYRRDSWGGIAYHPKVILTVIIMCYCEGIRESRDIERKCRTDIRLIGLLGDSIPDHSTISRFINRFLKEIEEIFDQVVDLLIEEGIIDTSAVAIDGTKLRGNASMESNKTYKTILSKIETLKDKIVEKTKQILEPLIGDKPKTRFSLEKMEEQLSRYNEAKNIIENKHLDNFSEYQEKILKRDNQERKSGKKIRGRKLIPVSKEVDPKIKCNISDPESLVQKGKNGYIQGYNAQAAVSKNHYILAADLVSDQNDLQQLLPMVEQILDTYTKNNISPVCTVLLADAGYCVYQNMPEVFDAGFDLYIPSQKECKIESNQSDKQFPLLLIDMCNNGFANNPSCILATLGDYVYHKWLNDEHEWNYNNTIQDLMAIKISSPSGRENYRMRKWIVESIFGYLKEGLKILSFLRRGLDKCRSEWKLICLSYNIKRAWKQGFSC